MNNRDTNSLKRVIKETITSYKIESFIVLVLIIVSSIANVYGSMFLKSLIDDYIVPLLSQTVPNYIPLFNALMELAIIYGVGILATYGFNRIMVTISLGTLKHIRDELFEHMQTLPLRFFDTHAHGDIMSVYTNDTDTLRQLISQRAYLMHTKRRRRRYWKNIRLFMQIRHGNIEMLKERAWPKIIIRQCQWRRFAACRLRNGLTKMLCCFYGSHAHSYPNLLR